MDAIFALLQQAPALSLGFAAVLGLCVGSFLNVVIYRVPLIMRQEWRKETVLFWQDEPDLADTHKNALQKTVEHDTPISLSFPPSGCPKCNHKIRFYENIPIISWLFLRGQCSGCGSGISVRYPLVELVTAILSILVVFHFGVTWQGISALVFTWILIALTGIDFDTQLLPDRLVYPLGMLGLFVNAQGFFISPASAIYGALFGFLVFWSVAALYALIKKREGMGYGDFKLMAALGAWLGVAMLPLLVIISSVLGAVIGGILMMRRGGSQPFAFGPYIAIAGFVTLLFGEQLMRWYLGQF